MLASTLRVSLRLPRLARQGSAQPLSSGDGRAGHRFGHSEPLADTQLRGGYRGAISLIADAVAVGEHMPGGPGFAQLARCR